MVVTSDHGNSNPGLSGLGTAYGQSTAAFAKIKRASMSHEAIFANWAARKERDPAALTEMVRAGLGFPLSKDEADALAAILSSKPITEWNHQLEKPEGLLGQFSGNHTSIGWVGTSHTTDPTLVSAIGPQAARFNGMVVNTDVFGHLAEVLG